jgi:hypothetical protein
MMKTFRGLLEDEGIQTIRLSTNDGKTGYKIHKFQLMFSDAATSTKSVVQLYTVPQTTALDTINFDNPTLLGVGLLSGKADQTQYPEDMIVVFDSTVFNQDIYITHVEVAGVASVNYYLELEQVKLAKDEAAVATLKDMRGRE